MLTLIEPAGKKRGHSRAANRSGQHLLNFGAPNDEDAFDEEFGDAQSEPLEPQNWIEERLVGHSNSANYSGRWKRNFAERPTWVDVDMSLQQILRGNAQGNKWSLYARAFIQHCLFGLGKFVQRHSLLVITTIFTIFAFCSIGLQYVRIETDIVKLWVSEGGRLNEELSYFKNVQDKYGNQPWTAYDEKHFIKGPVDPLLKQIREDEIATSDYQVLIQTVENPEENILTKDGLLRHVDLLQTIVNLQVEHFGVNWTLADICFKPGDLDINTDSIAYQMKPVLERLIPCIWITPIDCFYEGSKPIGPRPPIYISDIPMGQFLKFAVPDLPDATTWSNINPESVVKSLNQNFDLGTMNNFFSRTGIGRGYLDRPCIDPLDPTCPKTSPNYYNTCPSIKLLYNYMKDRNSTLETALSSYEMEEESSDDNSFMGIFGAFLGGSSAKKEEPKKNQTEGITEKDCEKWRKPFLSWIRADEIRAKRILGEKNMPVEVDYGNVMRKGCNGFARDVMNWPVDMILGRVEDDGRNLQAEALQSVILVSSATEVYKRFVGKEKVNDLSTFNDTLGVEVNLTRQWSPLMAKEVVTAWQRHFTDSIYNHPLNFRHPNGSSDVVEEHRIVHPLAATSISDMLAEFCDFDYGIIAIGYVLMLIYAIYSQIRFESCFCLGANSATGLAIAGLITVTFASVAGLGLVTWFGVEFNAATTQIVPFLTLGVGVDNMFMLLHNYPRVLGDVKKNEVGVLLKEIGVSVLMTSTNNILAFLTGIILPIPALRSFCTQCSVLLTFNLIAILTVYPAMIAIDIKRRKAGNRDICCCTKATNLPAQEQFEEPYGAELANSLSGTLTNKPQYHGLISVGKGDDEEMDDVQPYSLRAFLRNYYTPFLSQGYIKMFVIVLCAALFAAGIIGIQSSTQGLDLSDVLPDHTPPSAFLKARDAYFSFYPMNIIIQGENVDFAQKQTQIEQLRAEIAKSRFVVKLDNGEPSERYWLGMFREWLRGLQAKLDQAEQEGVLVDFDNNNKTKSPELRIAYSLTCSYGELYDCSRVGKIRLIDESGQINPEGFYNYLYGWHEYEQMFYTVSQASFYPPLRKLRQGGKEDRYRFFVPPAPKPVYSQIPFYLTGLKDTPVIIEMIKEVRAISDNYSLSGLPNHPSGIAFTFWEQYLDLNQNLTKAIAVISLAVFCVVSLLLFNPWAALCIVVVLFLMTVELAGFLGFFGIKLNPVSAVSLITAVGIGVEFTAHVVFSFVTSLGTRNERMAAAIDQVFVPVIHGTSSTLLGILMLGFSEFEFVVKYFFVVMSALILVGLINGLMLLPVLLSLVGPRCELTPRDSANRLPVPPPLPRQAGHKTDTKRYIIRLNT